MALSKSEYMLGRSCHKRVEYLRQYLPMQKDTDLLSKEQGEVGQIVHYLAQQLFPGGQVGMPLREMFYSRPTVGIEISLTGAEYEARADVITMNDEEIRLIEVKSKCYPTADDGSMLSVLTDRGTVRAPFAEMIEDLTFQALVLDEVLSLFGQNALAHAPVRRCELMLLRPDTITSPAMLRQRFNVSSSGTVTHSKPLSHDEIESLFIRVDVTDAVSVMSADVSARRQEIYSKVIAQANPVRSSACKRCEFRTPQYDDEPNGFAKCWMGYNAMGASVLDVPYIHAVTVNGQDAVQELVRLGTLRPTDLPREALKDTYNGIQGRYISAYESDKESQEPELCSILDTKPAPHVFIDVEAFNGALSLWTGGRAYEVAAFQWSCHSIDEQGALHHTQWMHEGREHPAGAFLGSLYEAVKHAGTIYIWSPYEKTAVKHALETATRLGQPLSSDAVAWAESFIETDSPNVVDMLDLARNYYVHPGARGSSSIKDVLNAIWKQHHASFLPEFEQYYHEVDGYVYRPYDTLPSNYGHHRLASVNNGGNAMIAYYECMFGRTDYATREKLQNALFAYCELDTAAMVIIYKHWTRGQHHDESSEIEDRITIDFIDGPSPEERHLAQEGLEPGDCPVYVFGHIDDDFSEEELAQMQAIIGGMQSDELHDLNDIINRLLTDDLRQRSGRDFVRNHPLLKFSFKDNGIVTYRLLEMQRLWDER